MTTINARPLALVGAFFALYSSSAAAAPRARSSFDAGWRFLLGDPRAAPTCNASGFVGFAARQCLGQTDVPAAKSAAACASACACSPDCLTWDFSPSAGCWTSADECPSYLNSSDWIGGSRAAAPGPAPVECAAGDPCQPSYDDSAWRRLNVPHDYGVEGAFDPALEPGKGCLPKNTSWYRKTFSLPPFAADGLVSLQFDGVFRAADVFVNGAWVAHHEEGYTSFVVWLHNASAPLVFGSGENVLAVFVDATQPELWSYEQQGIYRHVWLDTAPLLSVVPWGFAAPALLTGAIHSPGGAAAPQTADGALLTPQVDIANAGAAAVNGSVTFTLADAGGAVLCTAKAPFALAAGGWQRVAAQMACGSPAAPLRLWNTAARAGGAYLHTASAALADAQGTALDAVSARVGLRSAYFSPVEGFVLNGEKIVLNGFSQHLGFGGCGGAVPERVSEFIIASLLGLGGTAYRTAHNPVSPEFLDLADEYGLIVWEESRFVQLGVQPQPVARGARRAAGAAGAAGAAAAANAAAAAAASAAVDAGGRALRSAPSAVPRLLQDAQDMVLRDRNHASIVIWSLCNELGCTADQPGGGDIAVQFKQQVYDADNSRPVTGNTVQRPYLSGRLVDEFAQAMDVQSFSHQFENVPAFHAVAPWKPLGLGESGSCEADRGEYRGNRSAGHIGFGGVLDCVADNLAALAVPYSYGSFHWVSVERGRAGARARGSTRAWSERARVERTGARARGRERAGASACVERAGGASTSASAERAARARVRARSGRREHESARGAGEQSLSPCSCRSRPLSRSCSRLPHSRARRADRALILLALALPSPRGPDADRLPRRDLRRLARRVQRLRRARPRRLPERLGAAARGLVARRLRGGRALADGLDRARGARRPHRRGRADLRAARRALPQRRLAGRHRRAAAARRRLAERGLRPGQLDGRRARRGRQRAGQRDGADGGRALRAARLGRVALPRPAQRQRHRRRRRRRRARRRRGARCARRRLPRRRRRERHLQRRGPGRRLRRRERRPGRPLAAQGVLAPHLPRACARHRTIERRGRRGHHLDHRRGQRPAARHSRHRGAVRGREGGGEEGRAARGPALSTPSRRRACRLRGAMRAVFAAPRAPAAQSELMEGAVAHAHGAPRYYLRTRVCARAGRRRARARAREHAGAAHAHKQVRAHARTLAGTPFLPPLLRAQFGHT
jgi:hypothetical protein